MVGGPPVLVGGWLQWSNEQVGGWLLLVVHWSVEPEMHSDLYHTMYCICGLSVLGVLEVSVLL